MKAKQKKATGIVSLHHRVEALAIGQGKAKTGIFASLGPRLVGALDGGRGFPRLLDGNWSSPFIVRELDRTEAIIMAAWAEFQLNNEAAFVKLAELADQLEILDRRHSATVSELSEAKQQARDSVNRLKRKCGEQELSDQQVYKRRFAETQKSLAPLQQQAEALRAELVATQAEFSALHHGLVEAQLTLKAACQCVAEHTRQRLDCYWSAALKRHPEKAVLPPAPVCEFSQRATEAYEALQAPLMNRVAALKAL